MKLIKKLELKEKLKQGGKILKFQNSGKLPIGNLKLYDYVIGLYNSFVKNGASPQSALDLTNLVVAEGGWLKYRTGDGRQFRNANDLTKHVIGHHRRMFPETLKSKNWETFYRGLNVTPKYKYNSERPDYKKWLYLSRPGIKKRINHYRSKQGLPPLSYMDFDQYNTDLYNIESFDA